ncbi:hypothetical protein D6T64_11765 [Cryobacterium melibiosiphilum]|uniref:DNA-binding protein n=1 Tax=Cryobacterium melibiosiphilum TaxID=995039 RepID=A0A3A5MJF7_9MICO|nr:hypothetical protein [Cryobacterium melibiosiphilum]RJT88059.1 hypothetical protein D6T64_11765 [Cryobacterium melibiosiphilum]
MSHIPFGPSNSSPAPVAYSILDAASAVGMSAPSFKRILAAGDITRRYPNSTPIISHAELVDWVKSLPVDKPVRS